MRPRIGAPESAEKLYNEAQAEAEKLETQEEIDELAARYERQFEEIENDAHHTDLLYFGDY